MVDDEEIFWARLLRSIGKRECVIFLGAGVAWPHLPTGADLSVDLAKEFGYPFEDVTNLPRVAQYVATTHDVGLVRDRVHDLIATAERTYLDENDDLPPHNYAHLAELQAPLYVTTNYDSFMERALKRRNVALRREICRWNSALDMRLGKYAKVDARDTILYYLHGALEVQSSMLLTEDDFVTFLVSLTDPDKSRSIIWHPVQTAMSLNDILFIGYSLRDWNFRVLLRQLVVALKSSKQDNLRVSIQVAKLDTRDDSEEVKAAAQRFVEKYFDSEKVRLHWADASEFLDELSRRRSARVGEP